MNVQQAGIMNGMTIYNYCINIDELVNAFIVYDKLFFFCPMNIRSVVQYAVRNSIDDMMRYIPIIGENSKDLMNDVTKDIELFQAHNTHPQLGDSNYLDNLELIVSQIEEYVDYYVRNKIPMNQQCEAVHPKWNGNDLIFALRIY